MVLVVGGTGTIGSEVLRQLRDEGEEVRALVRSEDKAAQVRALGAEAVLGDLDDPPSLDAALDGVDRLFVVTPAGPGQVELETNLIEVRFAASHGAIERVLADSGVAHTPAAADRLHAERSQLGGHDQGGGQGVHAQCGLAHSLGRRSRYRRGGRGGAHPGGQEGKIYELTGPEALTRRESVERIAAVLDRDVETVALSNEQARESMRESGCPEWAVEGLYELSAEVYDRGYAAHTANGVQEATGRQPRSWDDFARDHVAALG